MSMYATKNSTAMNDAMAVAELRTYTKRLDFGIDPPLAR